MLRRAFLKAAAGTLMGFTALRFLPEREERPRYLGECERRLIFTSGNQSGKTAMNEAIVRGIVENWPRVQLHHLTPHSPHYIRIH